MKFARVFLGPLFYQLRAHQGSRAAVVDVIAGICAHQLSPLLPIALTSSGLSSSARPDPDG